MDFSEKFRALLSLTSTKSVALAGSVNIDTAQISRMKTGARKMPHDMKLIRDISEYLARRFDNEYRLSALYELTGDLRLQSAYNTAILTSVIFDWLTSTDDKTYTHVGNFLRRFNEFTATEPDVKSISEAESQVEEGSDFSSYMKNAGKRQATRNFYQYIMSLDNPGTIRIFTDEVDDWLIEDLRYAQELSESIKAFTKKGFHVQRVQPPIRNIEGTFRDIERWLPAYVAGTMKIFYYPWARDELHRRTLIILPGHIALCSASLYGQRESGMTILTTNPEAVNSFDAYYDGIIERCSTMLNIYTLDESEKLLERIHNISKVKEPGVYKSHRLSAHTLPPNVIEEVKHRGSPYVQKVMECYGQTEHFKAEVLRENKITDIMCLPKLENVLNGKEPVPGTEANNNTEYYTPEEYLRHLNHIIWYLQTYPKYQAVLLDEHELENVVIYSKGNSHTILIKKAQPFTLFEITDRTLASAISGYLRKLAEDKLYDGSRDATVERILKEAAAVEAAIKALNK